MYVPRYTITNEILKYIGEIEAAREVIDNAPLVPFYEKKFRSDAIAKTVHHGTHIEGNDLTLEQTRKVLEGEEILAKDRDIQEVINYRKVMSLVDELTHKRGGYTLEMLLDIHRETVDKIIDSEKSGVLRKTQVILKEEGTGRIVLKPPPYVEVPYQLKDFFEWLNSNHAVDTHPIIKAGITHYILVSIHPFVEGNGRSVRAFSNLILLRENYDLKRFFALEENFDRDLEGYYRAFAEVDRQSPSIADRDITPWLSYFTRVVAIELNKIKDSIRKLSIDSKLKGKVGQVALTERQMKLIEFLSEVGFAGMIDLKSQFDMVSEDTILRDIADLMEKGIIKKEGKTKASKYSIAN